VARARPARHIDPRDIEGFSRWVAELDAWRSAADEVLDIMRARLALELAGPGVPGEASVEVELPPREVRAVLVGYIRCSRRVAYIEVGSGELGVSHECYGTSGHLLAYSRVFKGEWEGNTVKTTIEDLYSVYEVLSPPDLEAIAAAAERLGEPLAGAARAILGAVKKVVEAAAPRIKRLEAGEVDVGAVYDIAGKAERVAAQMVKAREVLESGDEVQAELELSKEVWVLGGNYTVGSLLDMYKKYLQDPGGHRRVLEEVKRNAKRTYRRTMIGLVLLEEAARAGFRVDPYWAIV